MLKHMRAAGAAPDMVGIGNEVNNGICWNNGVGIISDKSSHDSYLNFLRLLQAG